MKWLSLVVFLFIVSCAGADYRLIKNFYPATTDAPDKVSVSPTFPSTLEEGAVPDILSLKFTITNSGNKTVDLDPARIYLMIGTEMHSPLPPEAVSGKNNKVNAAAMALKRTTLNPGDSIKCTLYFPKTIVPLIQKTGVFNINMEAGGGKRIIVVYKP